MKKIRNISFIMMSVVGVVMLLVPTASAQVLSWVKVSTDGFGDAQNTGGVGGNDSSTVVFNGHLYVSTHNTTDGTQIYRCDSETTGDATACDSGDWTKASLDGLDGLSNNISISLAAFNVFNIGGTEYLYAGTRNPTTGGELWRCDPAAGGANDPDNDVCEPDSDGGGPDVDDWSMVHDYGGFGSSGDDADNRNFQSTEYYNDGSNNYIYVGVRNQATGAEVWRCDVTTGCDGQADWSSVLTGGFGANPDEDRVFDIQAFGGDLYLTSLDTGAAPNVGKVYMCTDCDGTDFVNVSDNLGVDCFNDTGNYVCTPLHIFGSYLYTGTYNAAGGELWRSSDGTNWSQVGTNGLGDTDNLYIFPSYDAGGYFYGSAIFNSVDGGSIIRSTDGTTWTRISNYGFDDPSNTALYTAAELSGYIYAINATANTLTEVWRTDGSEEPVIPQFVSKYAAIIVGAAALGLFGLIVLFRGKKKRR